MQTLILAALMALIWLSWTMTDDYVLALHRFFRMRERRLRA